MVIYLVTHHSRLAKELPHKYAEISDQTLATIREQIRIASKALMRWAETNPDQFYKLVVQLLPKERTVDMTTRTASLEDMLLEFGRENGHPPSSH